MVLLLKAAITSRTSAPLFHAVSLFIYSCFYGQLLLRLHVASADPLVILPKSSFLWQQQRFAAAPSRVVVPSPVDNNSNPNASKKNGKTTTGAKMAVLDKKRYQEEIIRNWPESDAYVRKKFQVWRAKIIPYEIVATQFPIDERRVILGAIREVEANSCIRFVPRSNETDYVKFIKTEPGCFSHVGHQGGEQWVNLSNDSACVRHALVVHELMHVLGWFHEHSRPDRDQFIKIFWHNVLEEYKDNFRVFDADQIFDVGLLPYDYHSVTHYHSGAFSRFGLLPTLTNWENRQMTLGNSRGLSPGDVQKLRRGYACGDAEDQPKFVVLMAGTGSSTARPSTLIVLVTLSPAVYYYAMSIFTTKT